MPTVQQQHVDIHRKLALRRRLLSKASEGAVYVPFLGDGDLAVELYRGRHLYGADLDPSRCAVARERLSSADIRVSDCDPWPFPDVSEPFAVADFDAYSSPYESFRSFWESAAKAEPMVLFFTDGHTKQLGQRKLLIAPDGTRHRLTLPEARQAINFYFPRYIEPWFRDYIRPWQVKEKFFYRRQSMLYWGVVVTGG